MTPEDIRAAVTADQALLDMAAAGNTQGIADALSVGRTRVASRLISARGIAAGYPGGPAAAEVVLLKLEGARDALMASADQSSKVLGSLLKRQLGFLAADGLDLGDAALRGMLDQFAAAGILTTDDAANLKALALVADPVAEWDVRCAVYAADGALLV